MPAASQSPPLLCSQKRRVILATIWLGVYVGAYGPGVAITQIDPDKAIPACLEAAKTHPRNRQVLDMACKSVR